MAACRQSTKCPIIEVKVQQFHSFRNSLVFYLSLLKRQLNRGLVKSIEMIW